MKLPNTSQEFISTYWLKEDLIRICEENGLPKNGSKQDLLEYISCHIDNKTVLKKKSGTKQKSNIQNISPDMIIDINYTNDERHRDFS